MSKLKIIGKVTAIIYDLKMKEIARHETHNLVTTVGFDNCIRKAFVTHDDHNVDGSGKPAFIAGIGIGTGTDAAAEGDTALTLVKISGINASSITYRATKKILFKARFGSDVTSVSPIAEVGVYTSYGSSNSAGFILSAPSSPTAGGTIVDAGPGAQFGGVAKVFAVKISDGSLIELTKGGGANQWYFDDEWDRTLIKSISDLSSYYVFALYSKINRASATGTVMVSRALFSSTFTKDSTNIIDVLYEYIFANA